MCSQQFGGEKNENITAHFHVILLEISRLLFTCPTFSFSVKKKKKKNKNNLLINKNIVCHVLIDHQYLHGL